MSQPHVVVIRRVCTISSYYGSMYVSHIAGTTLWIVLFREAKHCGTPTIFEPHPYPLNPNRNRFDPRAPRAWVIPRPHGRSWAWGPGGRREPWEGQGGGKARCLFCLFFFFSPPLFLVV